MNTFQQLIADHRFVKVTAADFNGTEWDGRPLEPTNPKSTADDLSWAMSRKILAQSRAGSDYAYFGIKDENTGDVTWAGPGDFLFDTRRQYNQIVVVPGQLMELLLLMDETVSNEALADENKLRRVGMIYHYAGHTYTTSAITVLKHLMLQPTGSLTEIANGLGYKVETVELAVQELRRGKLIDIIPGTIQVLTVTNTGVLLLASAPELLPGKVVAPVGPMLEKSRRDHMFIYDNVSYTEGAIRTLLALNRKSMRPSDIVTVTGMTEGTIVAALTMLKGHGMVTEGQTAFSRSITPAGTKMLQSNPHVLPI